MNMSSVAGALVTSLLLSSAIGQPLSNVSRVDDSTDCQHLPPSFPPSETASTAIFCVDKNGCCNFTTVQAAVDAVPDNGQRSIVWIIGIFVEKVVVSKPNITFQGQGMNASMIVFNDAATTAGSTPDSASVHIAAPGFVAKNLSFMNSAPAPKPGAEGAQAVAVRVSGDRAAFWGCGFFSAQDTLLDEQNRHYYKDCFIQGSIDFIFGDARSLYENCILHSIAEKVDEGHRSINGAITAQGRRLPDSNTGFSFVGCTIQGTGWVLLGRAWQPYSRVIFAYTYMEAIVASQGWDNWGHDDRNSTVFYGELDCTGDGADMAGRVPYARKLNKSEAQPFLTTAFVDGSEWLNPFNET